MFVVLLRLNWWLPTGGGCGVQREAERKKSDNLGQYAALKRRILTFTGVIVSSGLVVAGATGGGEAAQAFALGGILAVAYQLALNRYAPFSYTPTQVFHRGAVSARETCCKPPGEACRETRGVYICRVFRYRYSTHSATKSCDATVYFSTGV